MRMESDTIVALATAEGSAGLAVVRVSGPGALGVAHQVFEGAEWGPEPESHRAVYGILKHLSDCGTTDRPVIDQVLCLPLRAPRSYTGEDTVEFFCHGGRAVSRAVIAACRQAGARPATAGEFTRRAFLNGKLSLDQAEAVADLIHAESRHAARGAIGQLLGGLDRQLSAIEQPLLVLLAEIEGALEFSDDEDMDVPRDAINRRLSRSLARIDELLALAPAGRLLRDGVQVVLAGPTNAGKSSLFNRLLAEERALVDDEAGTTRDVVSAVVEHDGVRFEFHDTAGLRAQPGRVEMMGIERTLRAVDEADIILHLQEAGGPAAQPLAEKDTPVITVGTKADLLAGGVPTSEFQVLTSAHRGEGLSELWEQLHLVVGRTGLEEAVGLGVVLNERHRHKLTVCRRELAELVELVTTGDPGSEIVGTMLSSLLSQFGEISGRVFSEQLLESIFSRFCVGK